MALSSGQRIGPYEVGATIGAGGMGVVYRAKDTRLGRDVAIKVLPDGFATDAQRLQRFELEARASSALNHPNILSVFDVGTHEGTPYLVMELLEGQSLRQRLADGPVPVRKALEYAVQLAQGLAAAHEKGIIHRDVKPENVFVTRDGRVKILDFGLAKPLSPDATGVVSATLPQSQSGAVLGTAGYMSPEQVRGNPADARSDIFAFGAVLYEMLSGKRAFEGATPLERGYAILNKESAELSQSGVTVPVAVERIVMRCLEKESSARFQSAHDLAFALDAVGDISTGRSVPLVAGRRRSRAVVAVALLCTTLCGATWGISRTTRAPSPAQTLPTFKRVNLKTGNIHTARFGPGNTVYYSAWWGGGPSGKVGLYETTIGSRDTRELVDRYYLRDARGGTLAVTRVPGDGHTAVMTPSSAPREFAANVRSAALTSGGKLAAIVRDLDEKQVLEFPPGKVVLEMTGEDRIHGIRLSPSGETLGMLTWADGIAGDGFFVEVVSQDGTRRRLSGPWDRAKVTTWAHELAWSADGREIWFGAGRGGHQSIRAVSLDGEEREVLNAPGYLTIADVSPDGKVLVIVRNRRVHTMARPPGAEHDIELSLSDDSTIVDMSADGRWLLVNDGFVDERSMLSWRQSPDAGRLAERTFLVPTDGSPPTLLADFALTCLSPDHAWAAGPTTGGLTLVPTGPGEPRRIPLDDLPVNGCVWAKRGEQIVLITEPALGRQQTWLQPLDGGKAVLLGELEGSLTNETSPDGQFIVLDHSLIPLDGGPAVSLAMPDEYAPFDWSEDGKSLFVRRGGSVPVDLYRFDLTDGGLSPLMRISPPDTTGVLGPYITGFMAADGKSYAYFYVRLSSDLYLVEGLK